MAIAVDCPCGSRLSAPDHLAGKKVRCAACGRLLVVPVPDAADDLLALARQEAEERQAVREGRPNSPHGTSARPGSLSEPACTTTGRPHITDSVTPEPIPRWGEAFAYPFSGAGGVLLISFWGLVLAMLVGLLLVWLTGAQGIGGRSPVGQVNFAPLALGMWSIVAALPFAYVLHALSSAIASSAYGEAEVPRLPPFDLGALLRDLARWALAAGPFFGLYVGTRVLQLGDLAAGPGLVAYLLAGAGAVYTPMAWVAIVLHDAVLAGNPVTVVRAVVSIPRAYLPVTALTAGLLVVEGGLSWLFSFKPGMGHLVLWPVRLYLGLVIACQVGRLGFRYSEQLGWTRPPPWWAESK